MQIVIDIKKHIYDHAKEESEDSYDEWDAMRAIANGTPLPKGHGEIKDVSQIEIPMCEDRAYERWVQVAINSAPTIIEADRGE